MYVISYLGPLKKMYQNKITIVKYQFNNFKQINLIIAEKSKF